MCSKSYTTRIVLSMTQPNTFPSLTARSGGQSVFIADEGIFLLRCKWEKIESNGKNENKIKCTYLQAPFGVRLSLMSCFASEQIC